MSSIGQPSALEHLPGLPRPGPLSRQELKRRWSARGRRRASAERSSPGPCAPAPQRLHRHQPAWSRRSSRFCGRWRTVTLSAMRIALVAVARKLAVLAWHLLSHNADYHWAPAGLTATKHRELAVRAGRADLPPVPSRDRVQERRVLTQAEEAYRTMVFARQRQQLDAAASNGERSKGSRPDSRRSSHPQTPIFSTRIDRARVNATPAERRRA